MSRRYFAAFLLSLRRACAWVGAYFKNSQARMSEDERNDLWW